MSIEDFVKHYFPDIHKQEAEKYRGYLKQYITGKQLTWGRAGYDAERYHHSLILTVFAIVEGKNVLLVGKFGNKVIEDLKERFKIEVESKVEKVGVVIKLKNIS